MIKPIDYTKNGILNWICFQEDDKDMKEIIEMCNEKIDAMIYLRKREEKSK